MFVSIASLDLSKFCSFIRSEEFVIEVSTCLYDL